MPELITIDQALSPARVAQLREALLSSPLVSSSTLAGSFRSSRGFAMTFTAEGRAELERRFPALADFLDLAIRGEPGRALLSFRKRLLTRRLLPNAWYLNLLLLSEGAGVGRHLDGTLREPSGVTNVVPELVSVLYLSVPAPAVGGELSGGELKLWRGRDEVACHSPLVGQLVHFRGDLDHAVQPFSGASPGALRASLVCEQYLLPPAALARLDPLRVQSKAGFEAYLAAAQPRGFQLD